MGEYMAAIHVLSMRDEFSRPYPPQHWLLRAQEAREMARAVKDPDTRNELETIARLYERLAEFAGRRFSVCEETET
jgi:hypothetical protein